MTVSKAPYFVQMRGCINCCTSKELRKKTGNDYGFSHTGIVRCILFGCVNYGLGIPSYNPVSIANPFIDPEEILKVAERNPKSPFVDFAINYCKYINKDTGTFYKSRGVSLIKIISKLESLAENK
jgi:hypothetical protein